MKAGIRGRDNRSAGTARTHASLAISWILLLVSCTTAPSQQANSKPEESMDRAQVLSGVDGLRGRVFATMLRGDSSASLRHELAIAVGEARAKLEGSAASKADDIAAKNMIPALLFAWNPLGAATDDAIRVFGEPTRRVEKNGETILYYESVRPLTAWALVLTAGRRVIERVEWKAAG